MRKNVAQRRPLTFPLTEKKKTKEDNEKRKEKKKMRRKEAEDYFLFPISGLEVATLSLKGEREIFGRVNVM